MYRNSFMSVSSASLPPRPNSQTSSTTASGSTSTRLPRVTSSPSSSRSSSPGDYIPPPTPNPQSKPAPDQELDDGQRFVTSIFSMGKRYTLPHITPRDMNYFTMAPFDLSSGSFADGGPRFIAPAPFDGMNDFVQRNRPWETYDFDPIPQESLPGQSENTLSSRFHTGGFLLKSFRHSAKKHGEDEFGFFNDAWVLQTPEMLGEPFTRYRFYNTDGGKVTWLLEKIFVPVDKTKPHIQALVTDSTNLLPGRLSTAEMAVAAGLIAIRRCYHGFNGHRYIPITIFSACDARIRVVQIWHDRQQPRALHIRQSRIMEFWKGPSENWQDWVTVLRWMMGSPVGQTMIV